MCENSWHVPHAKSFSLSHNGRALALWRGTVPHRPVLGYSLWCLRIYKV